jgi:hypothetical protein
MADSSKKERSRAYPVMTLEEALNRIASINESLGLNGQFNRESIAVGMGYSSLNGASARAVAALAHYGLLDREKDQYSLSQTAKKYLLPINDSDKEDAMRDAALSPSLFMEIYDAFKGQVIPRQFTNRLIQEFGIQQKAAADVERIFRNTMETAGFLKSNGILNAESPEASTSAPAAKVTAETPEHKQVQASKSNELATPAGYLSVRLPSGLMVSYPQTLASAFAFGQFGQKLKDLDDAVAEYSKSVDSEEKTDE